MEKHEIQYVDQNTYNRIMSNMAIRVFGKYVENLKNVSKIDLDDKAMLYFSAWITEVLMASDEYVIDWIKHRDQADASLFSQMLDENIGDFFVNDVMSKYRVNKD